MIKRLLFALPLLLLPSLASAQVVNWGDYQDSNQTIYLYFNTVGQDGEPDTLTSGAVEIYEDGSDTPITSAETLTASADSITGFNRLAVDLSDAGFEDGKTYTAILTAGTVDSVSVAGRVVGVFSVGRYASVNVTDGVVEANAVSLPGVIYLDDGGNDSNDGLTPATAKATLAAASTAAGVGGTVIVLPGTWSVAQTLSIDGQTIRGVDKQSCTFTLSTSNSRTITVTGDSVTIDNLIVTNTGSEGGGSNGPVAIYAGGTHNFTVRNCTTTGKKDSIDLRDSFHAKVLDCDVNGTWDCINVGGARNFEIVGNQISCDGSWSDLSVVTSGIAGGTFLGGEPEDNRQVGVIKYNEIRVVTSAARTNDIVGINFGGLADIDGNKIVVIASNGSATGDVFGFSDVAGSQAAFALGRANAIYTDNAGSGDEQHINLAHAESASVVEASAFDASKIVGNVNAPLMPTVVGSTLDVTATGAAGIDWGNVENATTTVDFSGTTVGTAAAIGAGGINASSFDNTTAAALTPERAGYLDELNIGGETLAHTGNASSFKATGFAVAGDAMTLTSGERNSVADAVLDEALSGHTTPGTLGKALGDTASTVATNLDAKVSEAGGGGGLTIPVNQVVVPNSRTWLLKATDDGLKDEEPKTMRVGESKVFAIDFREDLPTNGRLSGVDTIAIESGTSGGVTFADSESDPGVDKTQAKVTITGVTAGTYEIECEVEYQAGAGGGTARGVVTLVVTE